MLPPDGSFSPQNEFKGQLSPQKDYYGLVCHPTQLLAALPRVQTHPALLSEGLAPAWWSLVHPDLASDTQEVARISLVPHMTVLGGLAALPRVQTHPALLSEGLAPVWWSLVH